MKLEERERKAQELNDRQRFLMRQPKALALIRQHDRIMRQLAKSRQYPPSA